MKIADSLNYSDNQKKLLRLIYKNNQTRNELSNASSLSMITISKFISDFLDEGIIIETGTLESSGGRKASILSMNPDYAYMLAVDIGCSTVKIGVVDFCGNIVEKEEMSYYNGIVPTDVLSPQELIEKLRFYFNKYSDKRIIAIGIGISGFIDYNNRRVNFCPNINGYNNLNLADEIEKHFNVPVYLDTSARCMAVAEQAYGTGKGIINQVFISIGFSISAGIIIDSNIFRGNNGYSGEIGHIAVPNEYHEQCTCGNYDCLETLVTLPIITNRIKEKLRQPNIFSVARMLESNLDNIDLDVIKQALDKDDKVIFQVLTLAGKEIGTVLTYLINIMNPELIVLGGGVIECFPILVSEVQRAIKQQALITNQHNLAVKKSSLGLDSALIGSAIQVINDYLDFSKSAL